jgi:hypothetical protein
MPLPNLTIATATAITLPFTVTTDPESNTDDLWYYYDAVAADAPCIGLHSYGAGTYLPQLSVWLGPTSAPVEHLGGFYAKRLAIMVPVEAGTRYYFMVTGGTGSTYSAGQTFTLRAYQAPSALPAAGDIVVPDDTDGFPAIIVSGTDGTVKRFVDIPAGGTAEVLPSGYVLAEDQIDNNLKLYSPTLTQLASVAISNARMRSNGSDTFYVFLSSSTTLRTVNTAGAIGGTTWTLAANPVSLAPDRSNAIAYYASSGVTAVIRRWDLVNNVALSNLAAGVTNYLVNSNMFVMADGTILVHYSKTSGGVDHFIRRYNPDGTTAQTYNFGTTVINKLAWAVADDAIQVWTQATGTGTFKEMELAGGTFRTSWTQYDFVGGVSEEPATATPQEFGHSFSCPFFVYRVPNVIEDISEPCCPCDCPPELGPTRSPATAPLPSSTGAILPPVSASWDVACGGAGVVPTAADATDAESWIS